MRSEAQKEARRKYEASEKGKAAKRRHEAKYKASGKRAATEQRRSKKPISEARRLARIKWAKSENGLAWHACNRAIRRSLDKELSDDNKFILVEAYKLAKQRKEMHGIEWHVDHIIPISLGGKSTPDNIQVVPASWNRSKSNKHAEKYFGA